MKESVEVNTILTLSISPTKCVTTLNTPRQHITVATPTATKQALMTSPIAIISGILTGAALLQFSHVSG